MRRVEFVSLVSLVTCLSLSSTAVLQAAETPPEDDARTLVTVLASAAASTEDCDAMVVAMGEVLDAQTDLIARLGAATGDSSGSLSADDQAALDTMVKSAVRCTGTPGGKELGEALAPLAPADSPKQSSGCDCDDWCPDGWRQWTDVSIAAVACLGGSNIACCQATSWTFHSACIDTYCPTNDCCQNVPVSVPSEG